MAPAYGYYLPGDIFGLEFADEHTLSAEAISDAKVLVVISHRDPVAGCAVSKSAPVTFTAKNGGTSFWSAEKRCP